MANADGAKRAFESGNPVLSGVNENFIDAFLLHELRNEGNSFFTFTIKASIA